MNIKIRGLIFATFFGNCLIVGLLLASMTTDYWIISSAKRSNSTESKSTGEIHYGLFTGSKNLNVGYGVRSSSIKVFTFVQNEPDIINFWLWLGTVIGTGLALLSSAIGAIAAVLKTASSSKTNHMIILLFTVNIFSFILQILSLTCWLVEFYLYLIHNVLMMEDRKLNWYSHGLARIGFSFYLIVLSAVIVLVNIIILIVACKKQKMERRRMEPPCEEKTQGAIMLY